MGTQLSEHSLERVDADLRVAVRKLLVSPLLRRAATPEDYERVRRTLVPVEAWFAQTTGWRVVHDRPAGIIRLFKVTDRPDHTRPATAEFTRRHYVIACLLLAELDQMGRQTTLKELAQRLRDATADEPSLGIYDATLRTERRTLVHVVRWLVDGVGVLRRRDEVRAGETHYHPDRDNDALYDVDDRALALLLSCPRSPSAVRDPTQLIESLPIETEDILRQARGRQVYRRLLEEPVVYYDTLTPDERDWLLHSLRRIGEQLTRIGLVIERRLEGIAVIDPEGELTDETFPRANATHAHAALLLAEWLTDVRGVEMDEVVSRVAEWQTAAVEQIWAQKTAGEIAMSAVSLLEKFSLVVVKGTRVNALPAIARFRAGAVGSDV